MLPLSLDAPSSGVTPDQTLLGQLQQSLRELVYAQGRLHPGEVDVRFEMPIKEWVDSLTRPTVSIYLFDLRENLDMRVNGAVTPPVREGGRAVVRTPLRRFELLFMISVITTRVDDEYAILWRLLNTLLRFPTLPGSVLHGALAELDPPPALKVGRMIEGPSPLSIWSALEMPPRPSLLVAVTLPTDRDDLFEVPLVLSRDLHVLRPDPEREAGGLGLAPAGNVLVQRSTRIGGVLRTHSGQPLANAIIQIEGRPLAITTNEEGHFTINGVQPGALAVTVTTPDGASCRASLTVPSGSYDIVVDQG